MNWLFNLFRRSDPEPERPFIYGAESMRLEDGVWIVKMPPERKPAPLEFPPIDGSFDGWSKFPERESGAPLTGVQVYESVLAPGKDAREFYPPIDLGAIPGDGPNHPFEPFNYTERS